MDVKYHVIRIPLGLAVLLPKILLNHGTANRVIEIFVLLKGLDCKVAVDLLEIPIPAP